MRNGQQRTDGRGILFSQKAGHFGDRIWCVGKVFWGMVEVEVVGDVVEVAGVGVRRRELVIEG